MFSDEDALLLYDPDHSETEDRYLLVGMSLIARVLLVCHCVQEDGFTIRIIHARKATGREWKQYWERLNQ